MSRVSEMTKARIVCFLLFYLGSQHFISSQNTNAPALRIILEKFQNSIPYHLAYSESILSTSLEEFEIDSSKNWKDNLNIIEYKMEVNHRIVGDQLILFPKKKYLVRGYVLDKFTKESLPGAHVINAQNAIGTVSDAAGHFQLFVSEGTAELYVSFLGYQTQFTNLEMHGPVEINFELLPAVDLPLITVSDQLHDRPALMSASFQNLPISELIYLPSLGATMDIARHLQLTAGILTGGDGLGGLHVRGGNADQNLVLLEDIPIYNAFHLFGASSIFNGDVLSEVKLSKGYFSPSLEGRLSSALEITIRDGHRTKTGIKASTGLLGSHLSIETPIFGKKGTLMLAGQRSHLGDLVKSYSQSYRRMEDNNGYFKPLFRDLYSKAFMTLGNRDKLIFNFYSGSDDHLDINRYMDDYSADTAFLDQYQDEYNWGNTAAGIKWLHRFSGRVFSKLNLYHSQYYYHSRNAYQESLLTIQSKNETSELTEFRSSIQESGLRGNLSIPLGFTHQLEAGFRLADHRYMPGIIAYGEDAINMPAFSIGKPLPKLDNRLFDTLDFHSNQLTLFFEDRWNPSNRWDIDFGANSGVFISDRKSFFSLQPRINIRYNTGKHLFGLSISKLFQPQHAITADDNGLPNDLWVPATQNFKPQRSWISDLSWSFLPSQKMRITSNIYYKKMKGLLSFSDNPGYLNFGPLDNVDASIWEADIISGEGASWGIENTMRFNWHKITFDLNYTFSKSTRFFPGKYLDYRVPYEFEAPHSGNISAYWLVDRRWHFSLTWQINSGSRSNLIPGYYELYDNSNFFLDELSIPNGQVDLLIMPVYHRLDISASYNFGGTNETAHLLKLSFINVYDRRNIVFPRIYRYEINNIRFSEGLPFIPSITYHFSWN